MLCKHTSKYTRQTFGHFVRLATCGYMYCDLKTAVFGITMLLGMRWICGVAFNDTKKGKKKKIYYVCFW